MADDEDRYYSITQLTTYSGLSARTIRRHMATTPDPLPVHRVGGRMMVRKAEFDAWVRRQAERPAARRARALDRHAVAAARAMRGR